MQVLDTRQPFVHLFGKLDGESTGHERRPAAAALTDIGGEASPRPRNGKPTRLLRRDGSGVGTGSTLNVAVAGSLVLYRLAGLT